MRSFTVNGGQMEARWRPNGGQNEVRFKMIHNIGMFGIKQTVETKGMHWNSN